MQHTNEKGKRVIHHKRSPAPSHRATGRFGALAAEPSIRRGAIALACIVGAVGLAVMGLLPAAAVAAQSRLFAGTFGAATSTPADPYPLQSAESVAVDDVTHDVYVSDRANARVEKFDAAGHFILMFGKAVNKAKVEAHAPEAEQNLCAAGEECQAGEKTQGANPLEEPGYLAVDNSAGPSQGDVYVATSSEVAAGLIDKFDAADHLIASWANTGQFDGSTATSPAPIPGPFGAIRGIAVDASGNLWVGTRSYGSSLDNGVYEFRQDAGFITDWSNNEVYAFALDSEDDVYLGSGVITKYNAAGSAIGVVAPSKAEGEAYGEFADGFHDVIVDPSSNELYGDYLESPYRGGKGLEVIRRYEPSCHPVITDEVPQPGCAFAEVFGAGLLHSPAGLAIDPSTAAHTLYVAEGSEVASFSNETVPDVLTTKPRNPMQSSATLSGTVNPDGVELNTGLEGCRFEWSETAGFYEHTAACEETAAQIGFGDAPVEVQAVISGLLAGHTYHYRLVAGNANDVNKSIDEPSFGADVAFGPPLLENESATNVSATSATLQTAIDPNDVDTSVDVEYGPEAGVYGSVTPEVEIGAGGSSQNIPIHIQGLEPSTVYHYRSIAINSLGTTTSEDHTFTTQTPGVFALLDGRVWELVSPPNKGGAQLQPLLPSTAAQAAASGDAFTYLASAPTESLPPGNSNFTQVLSTRGEAGAVSWESRDIATPRNVANGFNEGGAEEYRFFSTDLSLSVVQPFGVFDPALSAEASEQTPYLRTNYFSGDPANLCTSSCYRPLVTGAPGFANIPEDVHFRGPECRGYQECDPRFVGASPDGSHIVLRSLVSGLTEGAPAESLYEWSGGRLQPVSILPGGEPAPNGSQPHLGFGSFVGSTVSTDGSRIMWSAKSADGERLYLRDMAKEETVELGGKEARFQSASADGSRVLFTVDGDLYLFEAPLGGELSSGSTTDLTPGGGVMESVLGTSQDGSAVYFVSKSALTGAPSPQGEAAQTGHPNLYVYQAGTIGLIAVLSSEDSPDWTGGVYGSTGLGTPTRVSSDGRWLAFMSERSLTGYDNRDASSDKPDEEVFLYHATANGDAGRLVCASCDPTGASPHGVFDTGRVSHALLTDKQFVWSEYWLAANIPDWTSPFHQSRYLSNAGRLFFDSPDALVPSDTNGTGDVYEYEPSGTGSCGSENAVFSPRSGGCVDLISSGTSKEESVFMDASENGNDVFFLTAAQLSHHDMDTALDVYDARVGGGFPEPQAPPACEGDACQSPVAAPTDPTPGSLTYRGPGNLAPALTPSKVVTKKTLKCGKGKKPAHGKCIKSKKKTRKARKTVETGRVGNKREAKS